jgi:hypothetical protein
MEQSSTPVTVTEADRNFAADLCDITGWRGVAKAIREGIIPYDWNRRTDEVKVMLLAATHRLTAYEQGRADERAAIDAEVRLAAVNCHIIPREGDTWLADLMAGRPCVIDGYKIEPIEARAHMGGEDGTPATR